MAWFTLTVKSLRGLGSVLLLIIEYSGLRSLHQWLLIIAVMLLKV